MTAVEVGSFVLDHAAARADETGASELVGIRGVVWSAGRWADQETGEVDDVFQVATKNYGRIGFEEVKAVDVAVTVRCSPADAKGYVTVCQREMAYAKRTVDQRVLSVLAVINGVLQTPTVHPPVPSPFPSDEETAAFDAGDISRADELRRAALAGHPVGQAHDLIDRMNESTAAHASRSRT